VPRAGGSSDARQPKLTRSAAVLITSLSSSTTSTRRAVCSSPWKLPDRVDHSLALDELAIFSALDDDRRPDERVVADGVVDCPTVLVGDRVVRHGRFPPHPDE
jgi:hypothetical protein